MSLSQLVLFSWFLYHILVGYRCNVLAYFFLSSLRIFRSPLFRSFIQMSDAQSRPNLPRDMNCWRTEMSILRTAYFAGAFTLPSLLFPVFSLFFFSVWPYPFLHLSLSFLFPFLSYTSPRTHSRSFSSSTALPICLSSPCLPSSLFLALPPSSFSLLASEINARIRFLSDDR